MAIGCDTPSAFSKRFPLGEHAKWRCDTPPPTPRKGYLSDTCAIPHENKANGCDTPFCDTISKGYCARWGVVSHWSAKSAKRILRFTKAASIPARRQSENFGQRLFGFIFRPSRILFRKAWVSIKFLLYPPPRKGPKMTLSPQGGGGKRNFMSETRLIRLTF